MSPASVILLPLVSLTVAVFIASIEASAEVETSVLSLN